VMDCYKEFMAIKQAGPYTPGMRAQVLLVGNIQGGDGWRSGDRRIAATLLERQTKGLVKDVSFNPIFEGYGISPLMILSIEARKITINYVNKKPSEEFNEWWLWAISHHPYHENSSRVGKWMLFPHVSTIDGVWETIRVACEEGKLGGVAKVATMKANRNALKAEEKLICVYTYDSDDVTDLQRVVDHEWLLAHIPMEKAMLGKWLKAGYLENHRFHPTEEGTPQGGIISPAIANMTLDGLERLLASHFPKTGRAGKRAKVNLIR
jgi:hypothetical protein